ncbi:hypothetical protein C3O68_05794 [Pseudomonas aeruginosa]|nr:hypothetical protein C3O68_05794 [Pseudomonas aeruginosa]
MEAEFEPPHRFQGVIGRVAIAERIPVQGGPHAFPIVELVGGPSLEGLVIDRQLQAVGRAEHVRLATPVDRGVAVEFDPLDPADLPHPTRAAMHAIHQIARRFPALYVQGDMHSGLVGLAVAQHGSGQVIQHALEDMRVGTVEGMGRHLDLEVRAKGIDLDVVILDQQDQPQFCVLQTVLIAGVATDTALGPFVAGELDHIHREVKQRHDFRPEFAVVQLPHRIHTAPQNAHA